MPLSRLALTFVGVLMAGTVSPADDTRAAAGTFVDTCCLGTARFGHSATLLSNGTVLIVGGQSPGPAQPVLTSAELFDPSAGGFRATGSLGKGRAEHTATLLPSGKVLVAGGITGTYVSGTAELYDPSAGTFSASFPMQQSCTQHTATLLPNGKVLIAGGLWWGGTHPHESAKAELFDATTGVFTSTGSMTTERTLHTATLLPGGKVLIVGGAKNDPDPLASAELYDPGTGTFTATGSMATGRKAHTAALLPNGNVLIAGGVGAGDALLDSAEIFDAASGVFRPAGTMGVGRAFHAATTLQDGRVLITGGTGPAQPQPNTQIYDAVAGRFTPTGPMHVSRRRHTATLVPNGKVLVAGGQSLDGTFSCPELYGPESAGCPCRHRAHCDRGRGAGCRSMPRCGACWAGHTITIDFETYPGPDGKLGTDDDIAPPTGSATSPGGPVAGLSNQWASLGVIFSKGTLFYAPDGFNGSGFGRYYLSSQPVEGSFLVPVYGIAITSYSKWNAKLTAYDGNGRVLGVSDLWHPAPGVGGSWHRGTLRVCTSEPIAGFTVIEESDNASRILNLDRLELTTAAP